MDEILVMEIWDMFREYIPEKNKEVAANQFIDFLLGKDFESSDLEGLMGYDPHLDTAINLVIGEESGQNDNNPDDDYGYAEDEDY